MSWYIFKEKKFYYNFEPESFVNTFLDKSKYFKPATSLAQFFLNFSSLRPNFSDVTKLTDHFFH